MTETEPIDIEHIAPLESDDVPDVNQSHHCFSCQAPITGLFCASCGQKNDNYRRSIFSLVKEALASITAIESRIWRTWAALLFQPGLVAREFADGRRTHWSSPVRVYLAMSIILFGFMNFTNTHLFSVDLNVKPKDGITTPLSNITADELGFTASLHFFETQNMIDTRNANRDFELIQRKIDGGLNINLNFGADEETIQQYREKFERPLLTESEKEADIPPKNKNVLDSDDAPITPPEDVLDEFQLNGQSVSRDQITNFVIRFLKNPAQVTSVFNTYLPRIMFFMMPFTMLLGVIFIRGRSNALMYDHLVHAAYIHAVAFFFLFVAIILVRLTDAPHIPLATFLLLVFYLPISLKRMFKRGWFKTIWTTYGVALTYLLLMLIILVTLFSRRIVEISVLTGG